MEKFRKMIPWIVTNLVLFGTLYFGHFQGLPGFMHVFWFMIWALIVMVFYIYINPKELLRVKKNPTGVPLWLILILDSLLLFFIVWNHNIVTGSFYLIHMIIIMNIHDSVRKAKDGV